MALSEGRYALFGKVVIQNDDSDAQNANAKLRGDDGHTILDASDIRLPGDNSIRTTIQLEGVLTVVDSKAIVDISCATWSGSVTQGVLIAIQVDGTITTG